MHYSEQKFSIKDLEHLSGVKAHTIRIWEKRYNLLMPRRSDTNIRLYDVSCLQKILHVSLLNAHGYSISRIAKFTEAEIKRMISEVAKSASPQYTAINSLKIAMISFDQPLFDKTYQSLLKKKSFREICHEIFLPLLNETGMLGRKMIINPVHEQFLTGLIRKKLYLNTDLLEHEGLYRGNELFVLFLPEKEINDLGLLFLNYDLNFHRHKTMFLSPSLPIKEMKYVLDIHNSPKFISYFTREKEASEFIAEFEAELCKDSKKDLYLFGEGVKYNNSLELPFNVKIFKSISEFTNAME